MKSHLVAFFKSPLWLYYLLLFAVIPAVGFFWLDSEPTPNSMGSLFAIITLFSPAVPFAFYMNQITASALTFKIKYWKLMLPNLIYLLFISAVYTGFLLQYGHLEFLYLFLLLILLINFAFLYLGLRLVDMIKIRELGCILTSILLFSVNIMYVIGGLLLLIVIVFSS